MRHRPALFACLFLLCPLLAHADFNAFIWDNDLFALHGTDFYYTNGLFYQHVSDPVPSDQGGRWKSCPGLDRVADLMAPALLDVKDPVAQYRHSWGAGQVINTPTDLLLRFPDPEDQPYSGLSYVDCGLYAQSSDSTTALTLLFGVVGPWSLAQKGQYIVHSATNSSHPKGWGQQLHNELVVNLLYEHQKLLSRWPLGNYSLALFSNASFALGPLITAGSTGVSALYSTHSEPVFSMRSDFLGRSPWLSQQPPPGFYGMVGLNLNGVARNLFLDGNTWVDSPAVGHKPVVAESQLVLGYAFTCMALQLGLHATSPAFEGQSVQWPRYGTLAITWGCNQ